MNLFTVTAQKMKFSIYDFFSKCDQISSFLWISSHLLKKSLMENFIFCTASTMIELHIGELKKKMLVLKIHLFANLLETKKLCD